MLIQGELCITHAYCRVLTVERNYLITHTHEAAAGAQRLEMQAGDGWERVPVWIPVGRIRSEVLLCVQGALEWKHLVHHCYPTVEDCGWTQQLPAVNASDCMTVKARHWWEKKKKICPVSQSYFEKKDKQILTSLFSSILPPLSLSFCLFCH